MCTCERESVLYTLLSRTKYNSEKAAENAVHMFHMGIFWGGGMELRN